MDKEFAKAEDLWKEYKRSGEYEKKIGTKFKGISQSLEKGITGEEKLRADLCKLVLLKLKEVPEHVYFRNKIETVNKIIDQALEETGYERDIRYIEKAHVARLVNEALDNEKNTGKPLKRIFLGFLTKLLELFRGNK